ncbi:MAG: SPOR domain-containing protein [Epsilonproteobacteria bacterium]|nr:SPOR domain-containing protein [Campylobacterota bacterium]
MEEKNELSDIMLDKSSNDTSKMKKILLLSIILIILFLLILAGMKLFNKPQVKKNNFNIVLPPEPTSKVETKQNKEELFKQVPIIEEENNNSAKLDNFNTMVKKLKQKEQQNSEAQTQATQETEQKVQKATKEATTGIKKALTTNIKKAKPKITKKIKKSYSASKAHKAVYIQVGVTFKEKPNKAFLNKIKKYGYKYTLYNIKIAGKNATKILIGPYSSKKAARASISKIKKEINKAAFIYVVK